MFVNPKARGWTCECDLDPNVLPFHCTLPQYAKTPLHRIPKFLSDEIGVGEVLVKDESNRFGLPAFKILGASWASYNGIAKRIGYDLAEGLDKQDEFKEQARKAGLCLFTATDGNHGRAVARIAKIFGVQSAVFVPCVMVEKTRDLIRSEGAQLTVSDGDYDEAVREAERICNEKGGILIQDTAWPGYEEVPKWIVQGYSTMMSELDQESLNILGQSPSLVITPVGVGSLAHAVVSHYKSPYRQATILAVEPDTAACLKTSLENGEITTISTGDTAMCGMNCGTVSYTAWPYMRDGIDASITVTDQQAEEAQKMLHELEIDVGPCGAATFAALRTLNSKERQQLGITHDTIVVLLATEGSR